MRPVIALRSALVGLGIGGAALAWAQGAPLQTQDTNTAGVVAELTECKRSEGVLTVKVRLRNTTGSDESLWLIKPGESNHDAYYVVAAGKKYLVLRDSDKEPLAAVGGQRLQVDSEGRHLPVVGEIPGPAAGREEGDLRDPARRALRGRTDHRPVDE